MMINAPAPTGAVPTPAPSSPAAIPGAAAALVSASATDALGQVDATLAKVAIMSVGGGTPAGIAASRAAGGLLSDASMLLQQAHVKAIDQLRTFADELSLRLMGSAAGLAFVGGQVASAGQSQAPVPLAAVVAGPLAETRATMATLAKALDGANIAPTPAPVPGAPAETDARPSAPPAAPSQPAAGTAPA